VEAGRADFRQARPAAYAPPGPRDTSTAPDTGYPLRPRLVGRCVGRTRTMAPRAAMTLTRSSPCGTEHRSTKDAAASR